MSFVPYSSSERIIFGLSQQLSVGCDTQMTKREAVVNAADAGATEVRFINDPKHPGKLVVEDNGKGFDNLEDLVERWSRAAAEMKPGHFGIGIKSTALSLMGNPEDADPNYPYLEFYTQGKRKAFFMKLFQNGYDAEEMPYNRSKGTGSKVVLNGKDKKHRTRETVDIDRDASPLRALNSRFWESPKGQGKNFTVWAESWGSKDGERSVRGLRHYLLQDHYEPLKTVVFEDVYHITAWVPTKVKKHPDINRYTHYSRTSLKGRVLVVLNNEVYSWGMSAYPASTFGVTAGADVTVIVELSGSGFTPDPTRHRVEEYRGSHTVPLDLNAVGEHYAKHMPVRLREILNLKIKDKIEKSKSNAQYLGDRAAIKYFANLFAFFTKKGHTVKPVAPVEQLCTGFTKGFVATGTGISQPPKTEDPNNPMPHLKPASANGVTGTVTVAKETKKGKKKRVREILSLPQVLVTEDAGSSDRRAVQWVSPTGPHRPSTGNVIEVYLNINSEELKDLLESVKFAQMQEKKAFDSKPILEQIKRELEMSVLFRFLRYKKTGDPTELSDLALSSTLSNPQHLRYRLRATLGIEIEEKN